MKGITLIGMPGSGKSTVGKILAGKLGWKFLDLDKLIVQKQGMTHHEIMETKGPEELKRLEEEYTLQADLTDTVFAPPGSMIYSEKAMEKISRESEVIYLMVSIEEIQKRLGENLYKNGVIGLKEKGLAGLMAERIPLYEKYGQLNVDTNGLTTETVSQKIITSLNFQNVY